MAGIFSSSMFFTGSHESSSLANLFSLNIPALGMDHSVKSPKLPDSTKHSLISMGDRPEAYSTPAMEPADTPEMICGFSPNSSMAISTPMCENPFAPPPPNAIPIFFCLLMPR